MRLHGKCEMGAIVQGDMILWKVLLKRIVSHWNWGWITMKKSIRKVGHFQFVAAPEFPLSTYKLNTAKYN